MVKTNIAFVDIFTSFRSFVITIFAGDTLTQAINVYAVSIYSIVRKNNNGEIQITTITEKFSLAGLAQWQQRSPPTN